MPEGPEVKITTDFLNQFYRKKLSIALQYCLVDIR